MKFDLIEINSRETIGDITLKETPNKDESILFKDVIYKVHDILHKTDGKSLIVNVNPRFVEGFTF
ncbi:hypothetical protein [Arenibacter sp. F20364]|uniref:hypothetical protein n=1 Tax=Arenibacter sp. F20364 TaxID=2926415 RepID=UPI001FF442A7|nr:hypothetical protein [Arenibacter sp. F20364]MCK0190967.1 hypothetical protein [Arenibacter sp. F20364]